MYNWREYVTNDTVIMVELLITIKDDTINRLDNKQFNYFIITIVSALIFSFYAGVYFYLQTEENILFAARHFITNPFHIAFIALGAYHYYGHLSVKKRSNKEKDRLENLRLEMIDHLKNTWYINEHSAIRDAISAELAEHGINVRYKSK